MNDMRISNEYKTVCAQHVHFLLGALSANRVMASLSGHISLVNLCSLVVSRVRHQGLRHLRQRHPPVRVRVRISKPRRD